MGAAEWDAERYSTSPTPVTAPRTTSSPTPRRQDPSPRRGRSLGGLVGTRPADRHGAVAVGAAARHPTSTRSSPPRRRSTASSWCRPCCRRPLGPAAVGARGPVHGSRRAACTPTPSPLLPGPDVAKPATSPPSPCSSCSPRRRPARTGPSRRPTATPSTWEIAGSPHSDAIDHTAVVELERDLPPVGPARPARLRRPQLCSPPTTPSGPPPAPRQRGVDDGPAGQRPADRAGPGVGRAMRDDDGNVRGGVRLPEIDVPTAAPPVESKASDYCGLVGSRRRTSTRTTSTTATRRRRPTWRSCRPPSTRRSRPATSSARTPRSRWAPRRSSALDRHRRGQSSPGPPPRRPPGSARYRRAPCVRRGRRRQPWTPRARTPVRAQSSNRSWMATTGRDLITAVPRRAAPAAQRAGRAHHRPRQRRRSGA